MKLFIHVGLPKTGMTTFHYLFLRSKEINYLAQSKNVTVRKNEGVFEMIWQSMIHDNLKKYKKKIRKNYKKIVLNLSKDKNNVLLIEGISDFFFYYRRKKDFIKRLKFLETEIKQKVKTNIILMLRKQPDFIISRYIESPEFFSGLKKDWKNFDNIISSYSKSSKIKNIQQKNFINHLNYSSICLALFKVFKRKNTHIFFYEELKHDTSKFSKKISKLLQINFKTTFQFFKKNQFNKSHKTKYFGHILKKKQIEYNITNNKIYEQLHKYIPLKLKYFVKNSAKYLDFLILFIKFIFNSNKKIEIKTYDKNLIKKYYYKDNKKLEKILGVDLKKWDYC